MAGRPEFIGLDSWLNTAAPLTLAGLRGKVVLVDFWTYSCINCRRTLPLPEPLAGGIRRRGPAGRRHPHARFGFEHIAP